MSSDIGPGRGSKPRYLNRALTDAERSRLHRARKAGKPIPVLDPFAELKALWKHYEADPFNEGIHQDIVKEVGKLMGKYIC